MRYRYYVSQPWLFALISSGTIAPTKAQRHGQRCLFVTDNFYEWCKSDRQPFAIGMAEDGLMTMAGLWDEWLDPKSQPRDHAHLHHHHGRTE